jgi:acyl-coenzyme A thioesterase PaaI-like protein
MKEADTHNGYIALPKNTQPNCFGCSLKNPFGLKMDFYTNQNVDTVYSRFSVPVHYCGWGTIVHGGIISTMLDEAMGWAALVILGKLVLSKTVSVEFKKPVPADTEIRVEAGVKETSGERRGVMQGFIYDSDDALCARATSDVSLFTLDSVKKLGALDGEMLAMLDLLVNLRRSVGLSADGDTPKAT